LNLNELIKTTAEIADSRYEGDFQISRIEGVFKVAFRKKNQGGGGFSWVYVVEDGISLEAALKEAVKIEIHKAEDEFDLTKQFLRNVKDKGK
jgi:hypothetical protein